MRAHLFWFAIAIFSAPVNAVAFGVAAYLGQPGHALFSAAMVALSIVLAGMRYRAILALGVRRDAK